jgi:hypothetical protein
MSGSEKDLVRVVAWMAGRQVVLVAAMEAVLVIEGVDGLAAQEEDERRFGRRRRRQSQMLAALGRDLRQRQGWRRARVRNLLIQPATL